MRKAVLIAGVFSVVAVVCALKLVRQADRGAQPATGAVAPAATAEMPTAAPGEAEAASVLPPEPAVTAARAESAAQSESSQAPPGRANAPVPAPDSAPLVGKRKASSPRDSLSGRTAVAGGGLSDMSAEDAAAMPPPVEAVVVEEEDENGTVTVPAGAAAAPDDTDRALRLKEIVRNQPGTASWDLLRMFQSESDATAKAEILSTASQLPHDQNTRMLLQSALSPEQPADVRSAAVAHAAEQDPDLLLGQLNTSDPDLKDQLNGIFDDPEPVDESRVIGRHPRPQPETQSNSPAPVNQ